MQARAQLTWVLSLLEDPSVLDAATYESRFDATFRDAVPFEQFVATSEQLAAAGPFTVTSVTPGPVGITAEVLAADGPDRAVGAEGDGAARALVDVARDVVADCRERTPRRCARR